MPLGQQEGDELHLRLQPHHQPHGAYAAKRWRVHGLDHGGQAHAGPPKLACHSTAGAWVRRRSHHRGTRACRATPQVPGSLCIGRVCTGDIPFDPSLRNYFLTIDSPEPCELAREDASYEGSGAALSAECRGNPAAVPLSPLGAPTLVHVSRYGLPGRPLDLQRYCHPHTGRWSQQGFCIAAALGQGRAAAGTAR